MSKAELILVNRHSPGDVLMLTAAVRDLHLTYRDQFLTTVDTQIPDLWLNNPFVQVATRTRSGTTIDCGHPPLLDHQAAGRPGAPRHYVESMHDLLSRRLGRPVPVTRPAPDLHLSDDERNAAPAGVRGSYWVVIAGGKTDLTTKWWPAASYQRVVDRFAGRLRFVQAGAAADHHPPLAGVTNWVGRTTLRDFVRLVYHADGVVCPVTCAMHVAAAFDKPCVVIAGGREPVAWEMYPTHQFLHTVGQLPCCRTGGCWKARIVPRDDGDAGRDANLCRLPETAGGLPVAACMNLIDPADVCRAIERYLNGLNRR